MKIQTKLILLLCTLVLLLMGVLLISNYQGREQIKAVWQNKTLEKESLFKMILDLKSKPLQNLAYDYTYWDEMVKFAHNPDSEWARENIESSLPTYGASAVWVYRPDFSLVYSFNIINASDLEQIPVSPQPLARLAEKGPFFHFLSEYKGRLMEFRGAPIQPTSDVERETIPQGYFFVGRLWDSTYIEEIAHLFEGSLSIVSNDAFDDSASPNDIDRGIIRFSETFYGWDGKSVGKILASSQSSVIQALNKSSDRGFVFLFIFSGIILLVLSYPLMRWVGLPLKTLSRSLTSGASQHLESLQKSNNEFGYLARLIARFFEQNAELVREVEERTLAEKALRENENYLKTLLDSVEAGILVVDLAQLIIVDINSRAMAIIGLSRDNIIGQQCTKFLPEFENTTTKIRRSMPGESRETMLIRGNGELLQIICSVVSATRQSNGCLIISFVDISMRKKAEKELRESAGRLGTLADEQRLLLENARDFIYRHDSAGVFYYVSPSVEKITGYTREEWCTHYTRYLTDNPMNLKVVEYTEATLALGKPSPTYLVEIRHKDGHRVQLEVNEQPFLVDGRVSGIIGVARDVTERLGFEEQLRKSEERYRRLVNNMLDGIGIADLNENIVFVNPAASRITGYTIEELVGMNLRQIVLPEQMEFILKETEKRKRLEESQYEITISTKSGELRQVFMSASPFLDDVGSLIGTLGVFTDVTELRRAEQERHDLREKLAQAQRMESLAVLAGGVAHDLNNILGPLVAYPELILLKLPPESPVRKQVATLGRSAQEAANVIQDLLTLARRGRYVMKPTQLNDVITEFINSPVFQKATEKNPAVSVQVDLDESLPRIEGSATHLMKVVMNIIINAFDAMPGGGQLAITTSCGHLKKLFSGFDQMTPGEFIMLKVRDSGTGISETDLPKIFEPYFSKKTMGSSGSGLGLAVVYGVVKDHKGYYDVFSEPGQGTEFVLYFPALRNEKEEAKPAVESLCGTETVLVVDDLEDQRILADQLLSSLGYRVTTVSSGRDALTYLTRQQADIVVLDMLMEPDFDGLTTYEEMLKINPRQKAIIVSGQAETERINKVAELGAGQYLKKPFNREMLGRAIRDELDRPGRNGPIAAAPNTSEASKIPANNVTP